MHRKNLFIICLMFSLSAHTVNAQLDSLKKSGGIEIITSGGLSAINVFTDLLKGPDATVVFIPTPAITIPVEGATWPGLIEPWIWNPDEELDKEKFKEALLKRFKLNDITILHTRFRDVANTEEFVRPIRSAKAVWISGGKPDRFLKVYKGTLVENELKRFLQRGGIIAGESAGAMVQASFIVKGNEKGLGLLHDIAIVPHLSTEKRDTLLLPLVSANPKLIGLGIDDDTGFVIKNGVGEVFGTGAIAVCDNKKHGQKLYYLLTAGNKFDFKKRAVVK